MPDLYAISPFRSARRGLEKVLEREFPSWGVRRRKSAFERWLAQSLGTVYTFQGKEAEAVELLLGGRTQAAIAWAAGTPNILNVAVTRVWRRLYVVAAARRGREHGASPPAWARAGYRWCPRPRCAQRLRGSRPRTHLRCSGPGALRPRLSP